MNNSFEFKRGYIAGLTNSLAEDTVSLIQKLKREIKDFPLEDSGTVYALERRFEEIKKLRKELAEEEAKAYGVK